MEPVRVSHTEIRTLIRPIHSVLLLRRTSQNNLNYADYHDVDEDRATLPYAGGRYLDIDYEVNGVFRREILHVSTFAHPVVASSDIGNGINYSDAHDVDEDLRTIICHGAMWTEGSLVGAVRRVVSYDPSRTFPTVASSYI